MGIRLKFQAKICNRLHLREDAVPVSSYYGTSITELKFWAILVSSIVATTGLQAPTESHVMLNGPEESEKAKSWKSKTESAEIAG